MIRIFNEKNLEFKNIITKLNDLEKEFSKNKEVICEKSIDTIVPDNRKSTFFRKTTNKAKDLITYITLFEKIKEKAPEIMAFLNPAKDSLMDIVGYLKDNADQFF